MVAEGRPTIAVVGGKLKIVRKARELGLGVVYLQHPDEYGREHWAYVDQALLVDYTDTERVLPLVRALHKSFPFQAVVSLGELGLLPAARIDDALGLGGNPVDAVAMLLDKSRMRRHLDALGISPVAAAVGRTEADIRAFVAVHGLPIVVKPVDEGGSIGIFAVLDEADLASVVERFRTLGSQIDKRDLAGDLDRFLIEEYLDGPEISVETLSFDGRHVVVAITDKVSTDKAFVETGHAVPSLHPPDTLREAEHLVITFLDAVGLRYGPGHTEVKLTSRGPRIVEGHNRVGGDRINELVEIAYGVDMDRYALAAPFDLMTPLRASPVPVAGAAIRFFTPAPGRVVAVTGADAVAGDPALVDINVSVRPGDVVRSFTWSDDRVGFVIARAQTAEAAVAHAERLRSMVHIHTEPT